MQYNQPIYIIIGLCQISVHCYAYENCAPYPGLHVSFNELMVGVHECSMILSAAESLFPFQAKLIASISHVQSFNSIILCGSILA